MKNKYITLDYQEYKELLSKIENLQDLMRELYDKAESNKIKEKITDYMTSHGYWI